MKRRTAEVVARLMSQDPRNASDGDFSVPRHAAIEAHTKFALPDKSLGIERSGIPINVILNTWISLCERGDDVLDPPTVAHVAGRPESSSRHRSVEKHIA